MKTSDMKAIDKLYASAKDCNDKIRKEPLNRDKFEYSWIIYTPSLENLPPFYTPTIGNDGSYISVSFLGDRILCQKEKDL